jgi:N utilization substance protein A
MKGTRVQSIIRELRGEKIDIVEWSEDPIAFVTNALSPAKVQRVSIVDDKERVMEVIVEDKQLSLAIGKKGQNVRLAAKLTGWRIDIKSEEEKRREVEAQFGELEGGAAQAGEALEAREAPAADETPEADEPPAAGTAPETGEAAEDAGAVEMAGARQAGEEPEAGEGRETSAPAQAVSAREAAAEAPGAAEKPDEGEERA